MIGIRPRVIGGWLLAGGLVATWLVGACSEKKGALMLAINTDMRAPKDVNAVSVTISTNGAIKHSFIGRVTPQGEVLLPATLAVVEPEDKSSTIRIRVMAFQGQKPRVLRDVRTTVPSGGRTALLRIPLNFVSDAMVVGAPLPNGIVPDPVPGTGGTSSGSSGSSDGTGGGLASSAADFDFMTAFQPPCPNIQDETIIDGECKDSYVDPESLPDFDSAQLGDSTDVGSCFDLAKCFAGATGVGDGAGGESLDAGTAASPRPVDPGPDASDTPKPFKDFRPSAVTLDRATCALQLNGANAARLNLAIVTPETGECVRPGECYVPIDRGAGGWQDDNGRVQLPAFVCKLLSGKNLRLATSSETCAAKEASNPICTPKAGEVGSVGPASDFYIPEDFATSVVAVGGTLYFASESRVGRVGLQDASQPPAPIAGVTGGDSNHVPWRFGANTNGSVTLTNGSATGFVLGAAGTVAPVTIAPSTIHSATFDSIDGPGFLWAVGGPAAGAQGGLYTSTLGGANAQRVSQVLLSNVTALATVASEQGAFVVGEPGGTVRICTASGCGAASTPAGSGRVDAIAVQVGSAIKGWALMGDGLYVSTTVDPVNNIITVARVRPAATAGIQEGALYFPHALAVNPKCAFFTSDAGLEYAADDGKGTGGVIVPGQAILGVAFGPGGAGFNGDALYYTVNAPRAQGGGIYRAAIPAACNGAPSVGTPDGGSGDGDGGTVPLCDAATCPNGCCTPTNVCLEFSKGQQTDQECGANGNACMNCMGPQCAPGFGGGVCGG